MKIGIRGVFSTERTKNQFITTEFLLIGLPIIPIKSYFVYNRKIEMGSYPIPLNKKNVIKNYLSTYLLVLSFFLIIFNFFLGENLILSSHINPFYYDLKKLDLPILLIEKIISLGVLFLSYYFVFVYGQLTKEEKEERFLIKQCEFWKTTIPGKDLVPILAKFYSSDEQLILLNQLIIILFRLKIKLNDSENKELEFMDTQSKTEYLNIKLKNIILSEDYKKEDKKTVSLLFLILSLKKRLNETTENINNYTKIKNHLLEKKTKSNEEHE